MDLFEIDPRVPGIIRRIIIRRVGGNVLILFVNEGNILLHVIDCEERSVKEGCMLDHQGLIRIHEREAPLAAKLSRFGA